MSATPKRAAGLLLALTILASTSGPFVSAQAPQQVGTWSVSGAIGDGRTGAASLALSDGTTLLVGGVSNGEATNTVLLYDPSTNTLVAAGSLAAARVGHTATALEDGRVLVVGGRAGGSPSRDVELFDPASGSSVVIGQLAGPRTGHAAVRVANGLVAVFGGANADGAVLNTVERVNVSTGTSSPGSNPMLNARAGASATMLIDGRVLVAGGNNGTTDLNSAELYYPWTQAFEPASNRLSAPRSGHSAILLPDNGGVLVAGGNSNGTALATADLFLPAESPDPFSFGINTFAATGTMAGGRVGAASGPGREGYAWVEGGGTAGSESYRFATIKTNKDDYAPGETAVITGTGWMPGEEVRLLFQEDPAVHDDYELTVVADAAGNIRWDEWAPEQHDVGVRFYLLASDSRSRAQTTFTDGNLASNIAFTITPASVAPGGTLNWSVMATCVDQNQNNTCADEGYSVGGAVQNGYEVEIQRSTNAGFTGGGVVVLTTVTTTNGVVTGTTTAPSSGGPYFYRARHPNQNLGNVPVQGNTTNSWQPKDSDPGQVTLQTDVTAPTTTLTVGTPKFGASDRFVTGATTFTLSCADNAGGTGCAATFYQLVAPAAACPSNTTEASWVAYTTPFTLPAPDGEVKVCYFSRDTVPNRETPKSQLHFRDTAAPTTTATATANAAAYASGAWTRFNVTLNLSAADGTGEAGVKEIKYSAAGATAIPLTTVAGGSVSGVVISAEGTTTVTFFAVDNVNNTETSKTFTVRIDKTAPTIVDLGPTTSANAAGWHKTDVTNRFRATDTLSGLDAACLTAFPDDSGNRVQAKTTTGEGTAITVASDSCADVAGNAATALTSASFKIDKTAPAIVQLDFSPAANAAGWHNTNVAVRFKATDALSGLLGTCAAFVDVSGERLQTRTTTGEGSAVTVSSDTCTDVAGNVAAAVTSASFKIDKTAPVIVQLDFSPAANAAGWHHTDVTVRFKATDALSGLLGTCAAFADVSGERLQTKTITTEGTAVTTTSDSCTDVAGNTAAAATSTTFKIDKTAPAIVDLGPLTSPNSNGWYNADVTNRFSVTDGLSGLGATCLEAFPEVGGQNVQSKTTTGEGSAVTVSSDTCADVAGNSATAVSSAPFKIDKTAPVIVQLDFSPAANAAGWHHTDVTVRFKATDTVSGLVGTCAAFLEVSGERIQEKTLTTEGTAVTTTSDPCTDVAGNTAPAVTSTTFKIDKTAPAIVNLGPLAAPNGSNGWYTVDVTNRFSVTDALSGLGATCLAAFPEVSGQNVQSKTTTGEGSAVTVSSDPCTDVAGNTATAATSAPFKIDKHAPVIVQFDFSPAANAAGWHHTDVTVRFKATDTGSGLVGTCAAFLDVSGERIQEKTLAVEGTGLTTMSDSCTDLAGNTAAGIASTAFKIDKTAPVIVNLGPLTSPNANGWYNANVTNRFSVTDGGLSGLDAACLSAFPADAGGRIQSKTTSGEGTAVVVTSDSCADVAGNLATAVASASFKIDKTAPVITNLGPTTMPNSDGWYNTDVINRFKVTELLSGVDAACQTAFPLDGSDRIQAKTTTGEGLAITVASGGCADLAGNVAVGVTSAAFKIDKTAPTVAILSPTTGNTIVLSIAANGTANDGLSGIKTVTLNTAAVNYNGVAHTWATVSNVTLNCGANTLAAVATDYAGLSSTVTVTVTRLCFTFEYLKPLEQSFVGGLTVVNDGKYGRVIPVKGVVRRSGTALTEADLAALGLTLRIGVNGVTCNGATITDAVEEYSDAGNSNGGTNMFRWTLDGFFIYNLDTKAPPSMTMTINNCYRLDAYVQDASLNKVKISESPYAIFKPVK